MATVLARSQPQANNNYKWSKQYNEWQWEILDHSHIQDDVDEKRRTQRESLVHPTGDNQERIAGAPSSSS